jgi:excinuclease UvrABC nuclease subunit
VGREEKEAREGEYLELLKKRMLEAARHLDFERAARLRDKLREAEKTLSPSST